MYLIDPDGEFHDYYGCLIFNFFLSVYSKVSGQNRRSREVANVIKLKAMEWDRKKRRERFWLNKILGDSKLDDKQEKVGEEKQQKIQTAVKIAA